jgi:sugar diacid utilization regulator
VHVNTVHYRISRIEELTGRSLRNLTDRLDLWAALRCPAPQERLTGARRRLIK